MTSLTGGREINIKLSVQSSVKNIMKNIEDLLLRVSRMFWMEPTCQPAYNFGIILL